MVGIRNIRLLWVLLFAATLQFGALACDSTPTESLVPATNAPPTTTATESAPSPTQPPATPLVAASESPTSDPTSKPDLASNLTPTATVPSENPPTPTAVPTPAEPSTSDETAIPEHFTASLPDALEEADKLGCTGWATVIVDRVTYYRACADDAMWEAAQSGGLSNVVETPTDVFVPPKTGNETHPTVIPTPTPAPTVVATPPPHYYVTQAGAEAAALEFGCSGWTTKVIEGQFYYRPCGDNKEFEILSSGGVRTLTGDLCEIESDPTARFVHPPTDLENISAINPPGSPIGGVIKPHSYIFNVDAPGRQSSRVPVYAIADSVLTAVSYYSDNGANGEYLIFFDVTCEISFKFDHLTEIVPKIAAFTPEIPAVTSQTTRTDPIEFKAGEIIGYSEGAGDQGPWDLGAYDMTFTNKFANQERYEQTRNSQSLHAVCPYEYFEEPLRSQMLALLGTHGQQIIPGTECFTTERDVLGAAAGAWFDSPDYDFADSVFSAALLTGDFVGITGIGGDMRIAKNEPTWLDPSELTDSHCYHRNNQWYYIEIQGDGTTMKAAGGSGNCPASLPETAKTYYR